MTEDHAVGFASSYSVERVAVGRRWISRAWNLTTIFRKQSLDRGHDSQDRVAGRLLLMVLVEACGVKELELRGCARW